MPRPFSRRLAAVLLLAALHMLAFDRGLGGDGWASFAALESLVDDFDLHLENNLRGVVNGIVPAPGGHLVMQYPPGILLLDLPPSSPAGRRTSSSPTVGSPAAPTSRRSAGCPAGSSSKRPPSSWRGTWRLSSGSSGSRSLSGVWAGPREPSPRRSPRPSSADPSSSTLWWG